MPPVPTNGYISNVKDKYNEGETVHYFCNEGYFQNNLSAPSSNDCTSDGTWSNNAPTCSSMFDGCGLNGFALGLVYVFARFF